MNTGGIRDRGDALSDQRRIVAVATGQNHQKLIFRPTSGNIVRSYGIAKRFSDGPNQESSGFTPMFQHELIEVGNPNQQNGERQSFGSKS